MTEFTEREMLIAKIGLLQGAVLFGKANRLTATKVLFQAGKEHGFTNDQALKLEIEVDQMLGDSVLI